MSLSRGHHSGVVGLAVFLGICAVTGPTFAQPSVRDAAGARALFREGVECADHRDWACAADRFERAYDVRPSPVLAYNLGHALLELGRLVEGVEVLQQLVRDEQTPAAVRNDAQQIIARIAPRIARLTVHVVGDPAGVSFTIDGVELPVAMLGTATPVDPGERDVEAHREGTLLASARVRMDEGGTDAIELRLPAPALETAPIAQAPGEVVVASAPTGPTLAAPDLRVMTAEPARDDGPWIGLGVTTALAVVAGAVVLALVIVDPSEPMAFDGNLGRVEIGR